MNTTKVGVLQGRVPRLPTHSELLRCHFDRMQGCVSGVQIYSWFLLNAFLKTGERGVETCAQRSTPHAHFATGSEHWNMGGAGLCTRNCAAAAVWDPQAHF